MSKWKEKRFPPRYFQSNQCQKDIEKSCGGGGFLVDLRPPESKKKKKNSKWFYFPV